MEKIKLLLISSVILISVGALIFVRELLNTLTGYSILPFLDKSLPTSSMNVWSLSLFFGILSLVLYTFSRSRPVVVIESIEGEEVFNLSKGVEIGRNPLESEFHIDGCEAKRVWGDYSSKIASLHQLIFMDENKIIMEHFGATPSFIHRNGKIIRVKGRKRVRLKVGDEITLLESDEKELNGKINVKKILIRKF